MVQLYSTQDCAHVGLVFDTNVQVSLSLCAVAGEVAQ